MEADFYYAGLPSSPVLVARTRATPWVAPTGMKAYRQLKELRPVGYHAIKDVWEDNLAIKLYTLLDSMGVKWTSIDVVRIVNAGAPSNSAPVIIWIGVAPESLSGDDGVVVAHKFRELLVESDIVDVEVEIRESVVTRLAGGPKLLAPTYSCEPDPGPAVDLIDHLTTTLGSPICAQSTPWAEGTGGFFIGEGGNAERLLLVTARHVVFPPNVCDNKHFERKNNSQARHNVTLFGDAAFKEYRQSIKRDYARKEGRIQYAKATIKAIEGQNNEEKNKERQVA